MIEKKERKKIRLTDYDYRQDGYYFVTICTANRKKFFGDIINEKMVLNYLGLVAEKFWQAIPKHYPHVELAEYVIMPNHLHGVLVFKSGTRHGVSLREDYSRDNKFSEPIKNSLSTVVNQYKAAVKRWCNKNNCEYFAWQERFYEHVIRREESYDKIATYIYNNPLDWLKDENYIK